MYEVCFPDRDTLLEFRRRKEVEPAYKWFDDFNNVLGGIYNGQVLVIGGGQNAGKTTLALNILHKVASQGKVAGYISTEMEKDAILKRLSGRDDVVGCKYNILDSSTKAATLRVATDMYSPKFYGDKLDDNDIVILDYLRTDELDAVAGSRIMSSLAREWKEFASKKQKPVVIFAQIKDFEDEERFSEFKDFWYSTSLTFAVDAAMCVRHVVDDGETVHLCCDTLKTRNAQKGQSSRSRFFIGYRYETYEIVSQSKIVSKLEAKEFYKKYKKDLTTFDNSPREKFRKLVSEVRNEEL